MSVTMNVFILDQDKHEGQIGNVFLSVCFFCLTFPPEIFPIRWRGRAHTDGRDPGGEPALIE